MSEHSILLTTDAPSLTFQEPQQQNRFELGVASAVFLWDDLATAVANNWGGPDSAAKREWLAASIVDLFESNEVATDDIEFRLLAAMEDEFDVTIETGTALQVAQQIVQLYQECAEQNYRLAQHLFERFQKHQPANQVTVQDENDDDEEDDEEDDDDDEQEPELMEVEEQSKKEPLVDEDGFTVVQKKGRR